MDEAIAVADKKLIDTLTAASAGAPVSRLFNSGNHDTYITHQIISINPRNNADDEASSYEILFGIDIYSRSNYIALMQRMITQLESADFFGTSVGAEIYEPDTAYYHVPMETKYLIEEVT